MQTKNQASLADKLGVKEATLKRVDLWTAELIEKKLEEEYGFAKYSLGNFGIDSRIQDHLRKTLEFIVAYSGIEFKSEDNSRRELIANASGEELKEVAEIVCEKAKSKDIKSFYKSGLNIYRRMTLELKGSSEVVAFMNQKVRPVLSTAQSEGCLSMREFETITKRELGDKTLHLPFYFLHKFAGDITLKDLDELQTDFEALDKNRNRLHQYLLTIGKDHLGKDYLDVFMDIMSREYLSPRGEFLAFYPPEKKKGALILPVGILDIASAFGGEFSIQYGEDSGLNEQEDTQNWLIKMRRETQERGKQMLERMRAKIKEGCWTRIEYRSNVIKGRTEDEDNQLLKQIAEKYQQYVSFVGDYFFSVQHGHSMFEKVLELDVKKIRQNEQYPEVKLNEIKDYVSGLIASLKPCQNSAT